MLSSEWDMYLSRICRRCSANPCKKGETQARSRQCLDRSETSITLFVFHLRSPLLIVSWRSSLLIVHWRSSLIVTVVNAGRQGRRWTWAPALGGVEGGQATGLRLSHASAFRADSSQKNKEKTLYQSIDLSIMRLNMHQPLWRSLCQKKLAQGDLCWIVSPSCICDCNCLCVSMYV